MSIPRRTLLQAGALSALGLGHVAHAATEAPRTFQPGPSPWRTFELSTEVQVQDAQGLTHRCARQTCPLGQLALVGQQRTHAQTPIEDLLAQGLGQHIGGFGDKNGGEIDHVSCFD